jgi:hypothetical protein
MRSVTAACEHAVHAPKEDGMTSRGLLWLALGAAALPLAIEATSGCSFTPGTFPPVDDNAYYCGCECKSPGREKAFAITAASDDAEQNGAVVGLGGTDLDLGAQVVGLRFANVGIPPNAVINSAFVQFAARNNENGTTNLTIVGQLATDAGTFVAVDNDLTSRPATVASVAWPVGDWTANQQDNNARTPNLKTIVQELVKQNHWNNLSSIVFRFTGSGQRSAFEFEAGQSTRPFLVVNYNASIKAELPICATTEIADAQDGPIPHDAAAADCQGRVATTLAGLAGACGYPSDCSCDLVLDERTDSTYDRDVCDNECTANEPDGTCSDFDPNGYAECIQVSSEAACASHVSANTTDPMDPTPVCLAAAPPGAMAARIFGRTTTCDVTGHSHIEVDGNEPTKDPFTAGRVDIIGDPCAAGGCRVAASFGLAMNPITFEVRFARDPMFSDLSALGDSISPTAVSNGEVVFPTGKVKGSGNGRRSSTSGRIDASNDEALTLGVDWGAALCDLNGNLAGALDGESGLCAGDGETPCEADSPDCDDPGGPCQLNANMTVDVALAGSIVNQPPTANAGLDQTVQCTGTSGASFTLNGTASDADENIAVTGWRAGARNGMLLGDGPGLTQSLAVGGSQTYWWRVIDAAAAADDDSASVSVVDTVAPTLTLSVAPTSMSPPNHKLVLVTATLSSTDTCDATPTIRLVSIASNEPDNGLGDGDQPNDVQGAAFGTDDRQFLLRSERAGKKRDRIYTITYSATDDSGNTTQRQATVRVPAL